MTGARHMASLDYGLVRIGNGTAFTHPEEMMVPLSERMRNQYCVLLLRPVTVKDVVPAGTVTVVRPVVKSELVARWIVKLVSFIELSDQFRMTDRVLLEFGPFTAMKLLGARGTPGTVAEAVFE